MTFYEKLLKLDLQTFNDEVDGSVTVVEEAIEAVAEKAVEEAIELDKTTVENVAEEVVKETVEEKIPTAAELLKKLGVESEDELSTILEAHKTAEREKMTAQEKLENDLKLSNKQIKDLQKELETTREQYVLTKNDVKPGSENDVLVLARTLVNEETTLEQAVPKILEKYPHFKGSTVEEKGTKPKFSNANHNKTEPALSAAEQWAQAFSVLK